MAGPNVRIQDELKLEAAAYAARIGISLNALAAVALRDYLDSRSARPAGDAPAVPVGQSVPLASDGGRPSAQPKVAPTRSTLQAAHRPPTASSRPVMPPAKLASANDPCPCGSGQKTKRCHPEKCGR